jgi:hypothetical protein
MWKLRPEKKKGKKENFEGEFLHLQGEVQFHPSYLGEFQDSEQFWRFWKLFNQTWHIK